MVKNFITKLKDGIKEFKKRDIIICAVALVVILVGVGIFTINSPDSNKVSTPENSTLNVPTSEIEQKLENILAKINGAGNVDVLITYRDVAVSADDKNGVVPSPLGAVILADGAENLEVRIQIQQAVQTALGIEAHQVKIFKTGNNPENQ